MSKKLFKKILPYAAPIAGSLLLPGIGTALGASISPAIGAAVGSAAANYSQNHDLKSALASGGGSYVGSSLGSQILGDLGTVGGTINSTLGTTFGETAANALPNAAMSQLFSAPINSIVGSQIGENLASSLVPQTAKNAMGEGPSVKFAQDNFKPSRDSEMETPLSLKGLGSLSPEQLTSNVATGGVYGGGAAPDEQDFFLNMINRRLVDDAGQVDQDLSEVSPIESSYLSQLGLGGYGSAQDLLQAISKKRKAA